MKISFISLAILIIAGIDNMKNMPSAALSGSSIIFFFALAAILFLIPTALVSAELSAAFPEKGGIYEWVKKAFNSKWALAAVWFQWINTMIWYPTMLSFIAATLAYAINPDLAKNKFYIVGATLAIFWGLTWISLRGIQASSKVVNFCSLIGTFLPMGCLIGMGLFWLFHGENLQIHLSASNMLLSDSESWTSLIAIMASFVGIELSGVHVNVVRDPKKNFPRAVIAAAIFILLSMSLSSLSIALIIPKEEISLLSGVMQVFHYLLNLAHIPFLAPMMALFIAIGSFGTMINWLIAPAMGLFQAAQEGYLPSFLLKKNQKGVPSCILIGQALLVSLFSLVFLLPGSLDQFFWLLTVLSTELYMAMYLMMFAAALKLHYRYIDRPTAFKIPTKWLWCLSTCGIVGCMTTILVSFLPPAGIALHGPLVYILQISVSSLLALLPLFFFYRHQKYSASALNLSQ